VPDGVERRERRQRQEKIVKRIMVRYSVKPDEVENNLASVRAVYEELHATRPDGFRYATFQLEDGVGFVHIHSDESDDGSNALSEVAAFKEFQRGIRDRCAEPPVVTQLREVGSYRMLGE
jgi:hypothetical protein